MSYSIGEFARHTGLSIKALHLYERKGLLRPALVDPDTGYRYYQPTQTLIAERIVFYRQCDLSLETIAELLRLQSLGQELEILTLLEAELPAMEARMASLQRMQRWVRSLRADRPDSPEAAGDGDGPISLIELRSRTAIATRQFGEFADVAPLIEELADFAVSQKLKIDGPPMLLWGEALSASNPAAAAEVEVAIPVVGRFRSTPTLFRRKLPGGRAARLVFRGPRSESGRHYERLFSWAIENRCQIAGPFLEIYLNGPGEVREADHLTELQVPVTLP